MTACMDRRIRHTRFQLLLAFGAAVLAGWGAFHVGEQRELAEVMRTSPHDGQAGLGILAAGLAAWAAAFFSVFLLVFGLLRSFKKPSE